MPCFLCFNAVSAAITGTISPRKSTRALHIYKEFLEGAILENAELVQAVRATAEEMPIVHPRSALKDWGSVKETLALLAFAPEASDHWRLLGVPKMEGPVPSLEMLDRRVQLARCLTSLRTTGQWSSQDVDIAQKFDHQLEAAKRKCVAELPAILREKKKLPSRSTPRWQEPSIELL